MKFIYIITFVSLFFIGCDNKKVVSVENNNTIVMYPTVEYTENVDLAVTIPSSNIVLN